jgi:hypothetical protein
MGRFMIVVSVYKTNCSVLASLQPTLASAALTKLTTPVSFSIGIIITVLYIPVILVFNRVSSLKTIFCAKPYDP